jgi:hypothetical protein
MAEDKLSRTAARWRLGWVVGPLSSQSLLRFDVSRRGSDLSKRGLGSADVFEPSRTSPAANQASSRRSSSRPQALPKVAAAIESLQCQVALSELPIRCHRQRSGVVTRDHFSMRPQRRGRRAAEQFVALVDCLPLFKVRSGHQRGRCPRLSPYFSTNSVNRTPRFDIAIRALRCGHQLRHPIQRFRRTDIFRIPARRLRVGAYRIVDLAARLVNPGDEKVGLDGMVTIVAAGGSASKSVECLIVQFEINLLSGNS